MPAPKMQQQYCICGHIWYPWFTKSIIQIMKQQWLLKIATSNGRALDKSNPCSLYSGVMLGLDSLDRGTLRITRTSLQNIQCSFMESHYVM